MHKRSPRPPPPPTNTNTKRSTYILLVEMERVEIIQETSIVRFRICIQISLHKFYRRSYIMRILQPCSCNIPWCFIRLPMFGTPEAPKQRGGIGAQHALHD